VERAGAKASRSPFRRSGVFFESRVLPADASGAYRPSPQAPTKLVPGHNREVYADGHVDYWVLVDTARIRQPADTRQEYALRETIEERHRQLKCFSDLEAFTSRAFNVIANQVVFVLLTYGLLQGYLLRIRRKALTAKTPPRTLELLRPTLTVMVIYYQNYMAFLTPLQHQELVLTLSESARK